MSSETTNPMTEMSSPALDLGSPELGPVDDKGRISPIPGSTSASPAPPPYVPPRRSISPALRRSSVTGPIGQLRTPLLMPPAPNTSETPTTTHDLIPNKFVLYENKRRFYIVCSDSAEARHRMLRIERTTEKELEVFEDNVIYDSRELDNMLKMLEEGSRSSGGLQKSQPFFGIAGFIRFTAGWYMVAITKRSVIALLGGHYIYHCEDTSMFAVTTSKVENQQEETRLINAFRAVDMSRNFYFSYTYDLTSTLQHNLTRPDRSSDVVCFNDRYAWNHHMLTCAFGKRSQKDDETTTVQSHWVLPMLYGHIDQAKLTVLGRIIYVTLIARRSRHFAGARYLKRGVNEEGNVANEVETEQIVHDANTTAFYQPTPRFSDYQARRCPSAGYTSYVQYRGSIPVYWAQITSQTHVKPPIEITIVDPFYTPAARHFDNLFARYGAPITVLNLIKQKEPQPREAKLYQEYTRCITYLNQFLPDGKKIFYRPWDMSQAYKEKKKDVIGVLEDIAEESIETTKFFHSGPEPVSHKSRTDRPYRGTIQLQQGVCRTNCVDCLDRTNAAQFVFGKRVFGHQLYALGVVDDPNLLFDSPAVNLLTQMYHDHGDTIALQYTGSALVNRVETYRRIPHWAGHSKDMIENLKRFYANSMLDADKQMAINVFLGIDTPGSPTTQARVIGSPTSTAQSIAPPRPYRQWFDPRHLELPYSLEECTSGLCNFVATKGEYWDEYYRPKVLSSLGKHFTFQMMNTLHPHGKTVTDINNSPFVPEFNTGHQARLMDGVRRWMAGSPAPSMASVKTDRLTNVNERKDGGSGKTKASSEQAERTSNDPTAIENVLAGLMAPTVPQKEQDEYTWYVDQYKALTFSQFRGERADEELYEANIRLGTNGGDYEGDDLSATGEHKNQKLYSGYVTLAYEVFGEQPPSITRSAATSSGGLGAPGFGRAPTATSMMMSSGNLSGWAAQMMGLPPAKFNYEKWIAGTGGSGANRKVTGDYSAFVPQYY